MEKTENVSSSTVKDTGLDHNERSLFTLYWLIANRGAIPLKQMQ
ncbi:MAG: hypothetical protein ACR9NN_13530 [Nostochopsis sp.]